MSHAQILKFARAEGLLACPLCGADVRLQGTALRCAHGHAFAVAAKGYANFVPNQRPLKGYDLAFFEARRRFLDAGFYDHVRDGVLDAVAALDPAPRVVLDVGCGEGYYARGLAERMGVGVPGAPGAPDAPSDPGVPASAPALFALDIAKDALQVAARGGSGVYWLVADLAHAPLRAGCVDCVLDVFTPANYAEFERVLAPGGCVVKVVPGAGHLAEVRRAAGSLVRSQSYTNKPVADYFADHFETVEHRTVSRTLPLDPAARRDLCAMTPLLFGVPDEAVARLDVPHVTVEAEILVGRRRA